MFSEQTRLKYGLIYCVLVLIEGVLKHFLSGFPFELIIGTQGAALGLYTAVKTADNQATIKTACRNSGEDAHG